jgi:hypothetical protein
MLPTADKWCHRVPPELHVRAHPSQGLTIAGRWFAPSLLRQTAPGSCGIPSTWRSPTPRRTRAAVLVCGPVVTQFPLVPELVWHPVDLAQPDRAVW